MKAKQYLCFIKILLLLLYVLARTIKAGKNMQERDQQRVQIKVSNMFIFLQDLYFGWPLCNIVLIYNPLQIKSLREMALLAQIFRTFSERCVQVGFKTLPDDLPLLCRNKHSAHNDDYIVATLDHVTISFLKQVSNDRNTIFSDCRWFILAAPQSNITSLLSGITINFDSQLVVVQEEECTNCPSRLTEWYRTTKNSLLLSNDIGTWSAVTRHLVLDYKNVWLRRTDLDGLNLKVAVQQDIPFISKLKDYSTTEHTKYGGYLVEIWESLQVKMNFTSTYYEQLHYNIFEDMINSDTEVGLHLFVMSANVSSIDHTAPVTKLSGSWWAREMGEHLCMWSQGKNVSRFRMYVMHPDLDDHWQSFVKPFSIHLWLAIVATLVLMPMILALSYITGRRTDFELTEGPHLFNIREAYIVTYGAFLQQSSENDPKSPSARLVFWLAFILGVVLYTAYSAALISKLTVQKTEYPFLTTEEMLRSGYKLNVVRGHYTLTVLQNMAAGPLAQVYRKHLHGNPRALVDDIEAGLMRVSRNSKIAFLDILERTEAILGKRRCSLLAIPTDFIRTHATLVVRKRMPYKKAFDYYLRKMWESGQLERLRIKWWATVKTNCPEEDLTSMDMEQVSAVFMCLLIGILVSLITFILETIHHKLRGDDLS